MSSYYRRSPDPNAGARGVQFRRVGKLACAHRRDFEPAPKVGAVAWCRTCGDWRKLIELLPAWAVRCATCTYGRYHGELEREAGRDVTKHKSAHPNHTVRLYRNGKLQAAAKGSRDTLPLALGFGVDDDGEIIPF